MTGKVRDDKASQENGTGTYSQSLPNGYGPTGLGGLCSAPEHLITALQGSTRYPIIDKSKERRLALCHATRSHLHD